MGNIILNVDSYKASHYLQYPQGTEYISAYIEARAGELDNLLFFGLQAFLIEYLTKPITQEDIDEADSFLSTHGLPFNREGWSYILEKYDGLLPLEIEAVTEGSVVPNRNVLVQVINTDPKCYWLPTYIETMLLRAIWYPSTVATISYYARKLIEKYLFETSESLDGLDFKLHDFGGRGVSSFESAALGGMAHLVNFKGSDTISGILAARKYYNEEMAGFSIPAAEHSTIIAYSDQEVLAYKNVYKAFAGKYPMVAVVSDSYDIWRAVDEIWGMQLKEMVESRQAVLVIRPDSGDPVETPVKVIQKLMDKFGYEVNAKGFKVLPPYLRVIQGDGINLKTIESILLVMKDRKLSADNIAFGMGAALLQRINRDTMNFAMKASAISVNGKWTNIAKAPATDSKKVSKSGRLALIKQDGTYKTIEKDQVSGHDNLLKPVFRNGKILRYDDFATIRKRAQECSGKA
jgi:nicotinamide phosphoribosyltransferase